MNSSDFTDQVVELVHRWLRESADIAPDAAAQQLADLLRDPAGLTFTVGFVDGVIRPEDRAVAAANLTALARQSLRFLPYHLKAALQLGGLAARVAPTIVIPIVRAALRRLVGHLVVDASDKRLGAALKKYEHRVLISISICLVKPSSAHQKQTGD